MLRISHVVAAATLVGGLAIAGLAAAGPRGDRADGPPPPFGGPVDFKVIDTDGDGSLSRAELMTRATTRIAVADANSDGSLDRAELAAALPGPQGVLIAVFAASPSERMADRILAETGGTEGGSVTVQVLAERQVNMLLATADTDRNAAISQEEADAMRPPRGFGPGGPGEGHGSHDMRRGALGFEQVMPPVDAESSNNG